MRAEMHTHFTVDMPPCLYSNTSLIASLVCDWPCICLTAMTAGPVYMLLYMYVWCAFTKSRPAQLVVWIRARHTPDIP